MSKTIRVVIISIIVLVVLIKNFSRKELNAEEYIADFIQQVSPKLPIMKDSATRWDSVKAGPGNMLTFRFSWLSDFRNSGKSMTQLHEEAQAFATENYRTNPKSEPLRKRRITVKTDYFDESGSFLFSVVAGPDAT